MGNKSMGLGAEIPAGATMTPADEAAAILIRLFDTIAYGMGKRLGDIHKAEIRRACDLLSLDGTLAPLDDLPRVSPAEAAADFAEVPQVVKDWKRQRQEPERRTYVSRETGVTHE